MNNTNMRKVEVVHMSMQKLICPYCGHPIKTVPVNDNIKMAINNTVCPKCHRSFAWYGNYGRIVYINE